MRFSLVLSSIALALVSGSCGTPGASGAARSVDPLAASDRLARDVAWLADDAREGRRSGEPGAGAAAEWIAQELARAGLEPAGDNGGWTQGFAVPLEPRDGGGSAVSVADAADPTRPHSRYEGRAALVPLFCSERGEAAGRATFCGFGIDEAGAGSDGWNDFAGLELQGAVAVVVRGSPTLSGHPADWGSGASLMSKVLAAKHRGAAAVLVAQHPRDAGAALLDFASGDARRAGLPAAMISCELAEVLVPGYARAVQRIEAGELGVAALVPLGAVADLSIDVERALGTGWNVLGRVRGSGGSGADRAVVIGAHYDHLGRGGSGSLAPAEQGQIHNGADDNASGTAAALEIARRLASGAPPVGDVIVALWSGEELGLLGSAHWIAHPTVPLSGVRANLNLDMVGRAGSGKLQVLGAGTAAPFESFLAEAGQDAGLELAVALSGQGLGGSDHQSFLKESIPALHLFSGVHADYHKPSDDAERFEAAGAARVVELCLALVQDIQAAGELEYRTPPRVESANEKQLGAGWRTWFGSIPSYTFEGPGVLLDGTSAGSPAEKAGMQKGDVLVGVGEIDVRTIEDFMYTLQYYKPGNVVEVRFLRGERLERLTLTLGSRDQQ
jgi:hypothetical protein